MTTTQTPGTPVYQCSGWALPMDLYTFENAPYCGFAKTGKTCPTTWTGFYKEGKAQGYSGTKCFFHPKVNYTCPGAYVVEGSMCTMVTRSEEHTSELQSLMRISYAVFCLKKTNKQQHT